MPKKRTTFCLAALAAMLMLSIVPAQADGARMTSCVGGYFSMSCVTNWRHWEPQAPQAPTAQEIAESRERDRQWEARCHPVIRQDDLGVARYSYSAPGCEYGRIQ